MGDILLIPGTTQSSAGFAGLAGALRSRGHHAVLADLPTARPTWTAGSFADLVADRHGSQLEAPVVVVAHSASGLLLPSISAAVGARHQVWLAAAVADYTGQRSLLDELGANPEAVCNPEWIGADPTMDPVLATYFCFMTAISRGCEPHSRRCADAICAAPTRRHHPPIRRPCPVPTWCPQPIAPCGRSGCG